jgi:hypothetical protein
VGGRDSKLGVDGERGWRHPDIPLPLEIIGHHFHGEKARVVELDLDGHRVRLRGPEDALYEHLEWAADTRDQRSWTRALAIMRAQRARLDIGYLRSLARERGYENALDECLAGRAMT